jgi:hypothetical protein
MYRYLINMSIKTKQNANFSKELEELRNIAVIITNDKSIKIKYDAKFPTCAFNYEDNCIILSTNAYPDWVKSQPKLTEKLLSSSTMHESLHRKMSRPLVKYVEKWIQHLNMEKKGLPKLAGEIVNIVEDKRCNYYGKNRYRFDLGKRQVLKEMIFKDVIDTNAPKEIQILKVHPYGINGLMLGAFANKGLYDADISIFKAEMNPQQQEDLEKALKLLEEVKYQSLRINVINTEKQIYDLLHKHIKTEDGMKDLMVIEDEGKMKGDLSDKLKKKLEAMINEELDKEKKDKLENDLAKGNSAGEGTGNEIKSPEPDEGKYNDLVNDVKPQIDRLLSQLKKIMKPTMKRDIYQKRGRMMSNLISRSYVNSMQRPVTNVYIQNTTKLEKEPVNIAMLIDFSGSVSRSTALEVTTILTETFGQYVEDYGFAIGVFAENMQWLKRFNETYQQTRARIPNTSVNSCGTRLHDLLLSALKMFNSIHENRRKIVVIASDYCLSDSEEVVKLLEQYSKAGIQIILFAFDGSSKHFAPNIKGIQRIDMKNIMDLPEDFLECYLKLQR